jgi:hypothetical protein
LPPPDRNVEFVFDAAFGNVDAILAEVIIKLFHGRLGSENLRPPHESKYPQIPDDFTVTPILIMPEDV